MAARKQLIRAPAPGLAAAALLLAACLVLSATLADAGRPLKPPCGSQGGGDDRGVAGAVESPAAGDIRTVVVGAAAERGGHRSSSLNIDMLGAIKDSGPSPGAGH